MKTILIEIDNSVDGKYPVRLSLDDGSKRWFTREQSRSSIPKDLTLAEPIPDPIGKGVIDKELAEKFFSEATRASRVKAIGTYLYQLLFKGNVKSSWEHERFPKKRRRGEGLRTILAIKPPELQSIPWELLEHNSIPLFRDPVNPWVRGHIDFDVEVDTEDWPLRALVIVGSKNKDDRIDVEEEVESISAALRNAGRTIEVDVLRNPSKADLMGKYQTFEPHIFHFIGHGGFMVAEDGKSKNWCLKIYDQKGTQWEWTADEIKPNLVGTGWQASFAFINACRSGDPITPEGTWTIAESFRQAGVRSVLSMMGDVRESAAQVFTHYIYGALAENRSLDCALAEARHQISLQPGTDSLTRQWALASLFISVPPEKIIPVQPKVKADLFTKIKSDIEFSKQKTFVDRLDLRLSISDKIDSRKPNANNESFLIVQGDSEVGKTAMLKLWLECCALRGHKFSWVPLDVGTDKTKTFLDVLRLIRDGVDSRPQSLLFQPLEKRAFNQFNWELDFLLNSKPVPDGSRMPNGLIAESKKTKEIREWKGEEKQLDRIFDNFRHALQKASNKIPLIIVLDQLQILPEHFNDVLIPKLFLPIKQNEVPMVRMILVASSDGKNEKKYDLNQLGSYHCSISVPRFKQAEFVPLAFEYLAYHSVKRSTSKGIVNAIADALTGEWKPEYLEKVLNILPR